MKKIYLTLWITKKYVVKPQLSMDSFYFTKKSNEMLKL